MKRKSIIVLIICVLAVTGLVFAGVKTDLLRGMLFGEWNMNDEKLPSELDREKTSFQDEQNMYIRNEENSLAQDKKDLYVQDNLMPSGVPNEECTKILDCMTRVECRSNLADPEIERFVNCVQFNVFCPNTQQVEDNMNVQENGEANQREDGKIIEQEEVR